MTLMTTANDNLTHEQFFLQTYWYSIGNSQWNLKKKMRRHVGIHEKNRKGLLNKIMTTIESREAIKTYQRCKSVKGCPHFIVSGRNVIQLVPQ